MHREVGGVIEMEGGRGGGGWYPFTDCLFVDVPNEVFVYDTGNISIVYWAYLVKGIWQTFRSKLHIFLSGL